MNKKHKTIAVIFCLFISFALQPENTIAGASASLNHARNGTDSLPVSPIQWVNGNLGVANAHYVEGMSSPYQCIMTGLTVSAQVTLTIGYDIRNSSKNAFDYLTHYNRIAPHLFANHVDPEVIDPLSGTGLPAATPFTTYPIPLPSAAGTTVPGQPTNSFNALTPGEKVMTLFNGTIDTIYYAVEGNLSANQSETRVVIKFTPSSTTAVLAWGGHIGSRADWGYSGGSPRSAGGISGSPFHMRLVSWNLGSLGNQDRSLSGYTVLPPPNSLPVSLVHFTVEEEEAANDIQWTTASEINNDYFTIERAGEDLIFQVTGLVKGAGNSTSLRNYSWIDSEPLSALSYYRLVQTDFDGKRTTYGPIAVNKKKSKFLLSLVNTFPNPFISNFAITFYSENNSLTLLEIMNTEGERVYSETFISGRGFNLFECKEGLLNREGIYFVMLSQGDNKSEAVRIVKK